MKHQRRGAAEASLSFLDVISCGFGAIVLLLIIARVGDPAALEAAEQQLLGSVREKQERLFDIRGESVVMNEQLKSRKEQLSELAERVARLKANLASVEAQSDEVSNTVSMESEQLKLALQVLTEEMERLLPQSSVENQLIGGIPVDSEYIIFVIDTSGSMQMAAWNKVQQEMINILNIYPTVKGIQVMNDMGQYMFSQYAGKWIPDTPARRRAVLDRLRTWQPFSNSSPVEGVTRAIRAFAAPDKRVSVYVFGDEFTGSSITEVLDAISASNTKDAKGRPRVRIHAIGFPVLFTEPGVRQYTGVRFATLMRALCRENGGTFVGLNHVDP